ncbi:uncharacterized protein LOC110829248 [Zootermopsis nevadensis]|uniref:uncharacterized protein LOC110829248 n=1 Tax=Zootermopsis nevadensis TaxID=136037 RepID=UPI000B8E8B5A|nr:uncharacterized protein LOC110829248 [Zootermopsis nevadensis]
MTDDKQSKEHYSLLINCAIRYDTGYRTCVLLCCAISPSSISSVCLETEFFCGQLRLNEINKPKSPLTFLVSHAFAMKNITEDSRFSVSKRQAIHTQLPPTEERKYNNKFVPLLAMETLVERLYSSNSFSILALDGVECSASRHGRHLPSGGQTARNTR